MNKSSTKGSIAYLIYFLVVYKFFSPCLHLYDDVLYGLARVFLGYSFQCINRCDKSYSFTWFHCYSSFMPNVSPSAKVKSSNMLFDERPNIPSQANVTKTSSNSLFHNTEPIEKSPPLFFDLTQPNG